MKPYTLGFIGCGHMGMAIATGQTMVKPENICVYVPSEKSKVQCQKQGFQVLNSANEVCQQAKYVFLAVRPQVTLEVLRQLQDEPIDVLVSVVTGYSIITLQQALQNCAVIRTMPNTPLQIQEGATALCYSENCQPHDISFIMNLFDAMGKTAMIDESLFNEIIAVSGSTPAYLYYFMDCILKDVLERGVDPQAARTLLTQTFIGAAKLVQQLPEKSLCDFTNEVCSKGGTTIEAIQSFQMDKLDDIVKKANTKCIQRAKELGN